MAKISIITPAYNAEKFLAKTLDSVREQTFTDWEQVIVNDGSQDGTLTLAKQYAARDPRLRVVSQSNGGVAAARNTGYAHTDCSSEFVIFLDHDDVWFPNALDRMRGVLEADTQAVAVHALARQTDLLGNPSGAPGGTIYNYHRRKLDGNRIRMCTRAEPTTFTLMICECCISTPGVALIRRQALEGMIRRQALEGMIAGGSPLFDQSVAPGDDWDLWLRLCLHGHIAFVDEVLLNWRQHGGNGSLNDSVTDAAESRVRRKIMDWPELSSEQRRLASFRFRRIYASVQRHNTVNCWRWMIESLHTGHLMQAAALLRHWICLYSHYLSLRLFWSARRDRGAIPLRIKDRQLLESS